MTNLDKFKNPQNQGGGLFRLNYTLYLQQREYYLPMMIAVKG